MKSKFTSIARGVVMSKGILFVLSGPSGVGKGTVLDRVFDKYQDVEYSVSMTTRDPRPGEVDGEDYFFVSTREFKKYKDNDGFIESACVHGNFYGTPKKFVQEALDEGRDIILEIDINGARQVRKNFEDAVYIFLTPPSFAELKNRLDKRDSETKADREIRLRNARSEMSEADDYDYKVVNDKVDYAADRIIEIIEKEKDAKRRGKDNNDS
ncbi:MAG: guanylate kinase [Bacillota bacterium]